MSECNTSSGLSKQDSIVSSVLVLEVRVAAEFFSNDVSSKPLNKVQGTWMIVGSTRPSYVSKIFF